MKLNAASLLLLTAVAYHTLSSNAFSVSRTTPTPIQQQKFHRSRRRRQGHDYYCLERSQNILRLGASLFDDFEEFRNNNNNDSNSEDSPQNNSHKSSPSDADLYAELRARQAYLSGQSSDAASSSSLWFETSDDENNQEEDSALFNWREATCDSTVRLSLDDWIRRLSIDSYPLCVCGSAGGNLYLADLQQGEELDCLLQVHPAQTNEDSPDGIDDAIHTLYGQFDGGGVVALAIKDDFIVSSGRDGGVHVCTISGQEEQVYKGSRGGTSRQTKLSLKRQGKLRGLDQEKNVLITSIAFDDTGGLWLGGYDGILRGYDYEEQDVDEQPLMLRQKHPLYEANIGSPIVALSINDEIGCGIASTATEGIALFNLDDGEVFARWNPFAKKVRKEFVRSAIIAQHDEESWSVFCGGSRGSLFSRRLNVDKTGLISESRPFLDMVPDSQSFPIKIRPNHLGSVVDLATPAPGLLVTGALDGTMRVWDTRLEQDAPDDGDEIVFDPQEQEAQYDDVGDKDGRPQCLYALSGYKVWLGSIFASNNKLVSDGADNTIIVHSFDEDEEDVMFREDEDDDMEGFSFE